VFHPGCGFVLLLAAINEDIMPGYMLVLASMPLAGMRNELPTATRVIAVGVIFTPGWLVEWRLIVRPCPRCCSRPPSRRCRSCAAWR
jgi:hypothetical protein